MKSKFTPIITEEAGWWTGRIEEIPSINCRAKSRNDLIPALVSALEEALEKDRVVDDLASGLLRDFGNYNEKLLKASEAWRRNKGRRSN